MSAAAHIAGSPDRLTPQQRELIDLAATLGRERFAPRAAAIDRDAVFPFENYADLRAAGLLGICVPKAAGGLGADFSTYVMVAAEVGRHCGATALTWNMHVCSTMWAGFIADDLDMTPEQRADHERIRVHVDDRVGIKPGAKYYHWELRGIPLRMEIGPRDLASASGMLVRRDTREKRPIAFDALRTELPVVLDTIQADMLAAARARLEANTALTVLNRDAPQSMEGCAGLWHAPALSPPGAASEHRH